MVALPIAHADVLPAPAARQSAGTIVGVVRNAANMPVAYATVTAVRTRYDRQHRIAFDLRRRCSQFDHRPMSRG